MFKEGHCCGCDKRVPGVIDVAVTGVYIHKRLLCNECNQEWEKFITTKLRKDLLQICTTGEQQFMYFLGRRWAQVRRIRTVQFAPRSKIGKYEPQINKILAAIAKVSGNKEVIHALVTDESTVCDFFEFKISITNARTKSAKIEKTGDNLFGCMCKLSKLLKCQVRAPDYLVDIAKRMNHER
jgi:hypothetical protein